MSAAPNEAVRAHYWQTALVFGVVVLANVATDALLEIAYANGSFLPIIFSLLIYILLCAFLSIYIGIAFFQRRWKAALSVILAVLVAYVLDTSLQMLGLTATNVRFAITRPHYDQLIDQAVERREQRPLLMAFRWGESGGAATTNVFGTLIYDESDEIAKPADKRSGAWRDRARSRAGAPFYGLLDTNPDPRWQREVRLLDGHFYLLTETY